MARRRQPAAGPRCPVRLPAFLRHLPICPRRLLPIPYTTARHPDGAGRFSANDVARKLECGRLRRCGICARPMGSEVVFLAQDHGLLTEATVFTDAPVHEDCAAASLGLCPYIARPRVPRRPDPGRTAHEGFDLAAPKEAWLMLVTASYEITAQPAQGGRVVWAFRPGEPLRLRRFGYTGPGGALEPAA